MSFGYFYFLILVLTCPTTSFKGSWNLLFGIYDLLVSGQRCNLSGHPPRTNPDLSGSPTSPSHIPTTSHVHSPTHASTQCSFRRITQRATTFRIFTTSHLHNFAPSPLPTHYRQHHFFCYFFTKTRPFRVVRNSYLFKTRLLPPILQLVIPVLGSTINLAGLFLNKMILISLLLLFKLINIRKYVQEKVCLPVWRQKSRW